MPSAKLIIVEHDACESKYIIKYNNIIKTSSKSVTIENNKLRRNSSKSAGDYCVYDDVTPTKVNGIFLHYFIKELENSHIYRRCVLRYFKRHLKYCNYVTVFMLVPPCRQIIDYQWWVSLRYIHIRTKNFHQMYLLDLLAFSCLLHYTGFILYSHRLWHYFYFSILWVMTPNSFVYWQH